MSPVTFDLRILKMASEMSSATGENTVNTTTNTEGNDSTEEDDDIYEVEKIVGMTTSKVREKTQ